MSKEKRHEQDGKRTLRLDLYIDMLNFYKARIFAKANLPKCFLTPVWQSTEM
jgi:ribosomal 50S subunit-recycling heat shock protein